MLEIKTFLRFFLFLFSSIINFNLFNLVDLQWIRFYVTESQFFSFICFLHILNEPFPDYPNLLLFDELRHGDRNLNAPCLYYIY